MSGSFQNVDYGGALELRLRMCLFIVVVLRPAKFFLSHGSAFSWWAILPRETNQGLPDPAKPRTPPLGSLHYSL